MMGGVLWVACGRGNEDFDASGIFESTEVVVSAEANGRIVALDVEEGDELEAGQQVGSVDSVPEKTAGEISEEPREMCKECQRTAVYSTFRGKGAGFTQLQAIQFLLENSIPKMGGIS